MTVCIAAKTTPRDPKIVLCMDMMGSTDFSSAETVTKIHAGAARDYYALIAGTVPAARELATCCLKSLQICPPDTFAGVLTQIRSGVGAYKRLFADTHVQSRMGISYDEFKKTGKASFPSDLYREVSWEIRNHYSAAELIIAGFTVSGSPIIVKVSGDVAWECDDFAVIGSGTGIGEASLFHRSQSFTNTDLDTTVYHVYEAKRLAEKAPAVGKKTYMLLVQPNDVISIATDSGHGILDKYVEEFSPRRVTLQPLPAAMFTRVFRQGQPRHQSTTTEPPLQPPSPELPEGSDES